MTPLLFLSMVVFGLALSPGVPPNAATAQGALAALAFAPSPDVPGPLAVWFGRFALALFPFGSPAFRLAAATSAMAGIAALVAARLLRHARGDAEGGTALWALEEQRRWTTAETAVLLFWALAGPAWLSARGQWEEALLLTVGAWSVERTLAVARSPSVLRAAAAGGALGLAVAADPRFLCLVPALAALAFLHGRLRPAPSPRLRGWGVGAAFVLTAVAAFLLPAALLAARESATIGQTVTAARVVLENWLRAIGPEAPWGARARAALSPEDIRMPLALALSLFAFWGADRRERRTVGAWLLAGASALFLPGLVSGRRPEVFQSLALLLCVPPLARAARQVLRIRPALGPALFLIPLIFPVFIPRAFPRHEDPEALAGDVFRSAAPGAGLSAGTPNLRSAAIYRQRVWGDRPDLRWTSDDPDALFVLGGSTVSRAATGRPVGFLRQPVRPGEERQRSPATLSTGRVPLLLAESGLEGSNPDALASAHRALGDAFFNLRVPDQAEEEYLKGLAHRSEDPDLNAALGGLFLDYGETARAAAALDRATRLGAGDPRVWSQSAKAEYQEGRLHLALERLATAAQRFPRDADIKTEWAELLEKLDRPEDAARAWGAAADLRPDDKFILWRLTQTWLRAGKPLKAYRGVEAYLSLGLSERERRDGEAFRGLLLDALNHPAGGTGGGPDGNQTHKDGADAASPGGVDQ